MLAPDAVVAIVGLGYVGLPLAIEFGRLRTTIGFDIDSHRVDELAAGYDRTREVENSELQPSERLRWTANPEQLASADVYIITVPTPIDTVNQPDLRAIKSASRLVGGYLSQGNYVIYESTVYPGATEEICVPILEAHSGLELNHDFFVGYSPERINPGDKKHRLPDICKITSGSTQDAASDINKLYQEIITAGTHLASSIRVAEAAKVIENTQRDVNIALINELAVLFNRMDIDTNEVLAAAGTKWNFLPFRAGLVGGHCIGVDPYYLTHKAQQVGYHPEVILAGRRINDGMGGHVADQVAMLLARRGFTFLGSRVLILGLTFKENCPDVRNTKVIDLVRRLKEYGLNVSVTDPWVHPGDASALETIQLRPLEKVVNESFQAVILAVAHEEFANLHVEARKMVGPDGVIYDLKGIWPMKCVDGRL